MEPQWHNLPADLRHSRWHPGPSSMSLLRFAPASEIERIVCGAERPGYHSKRVDAETVHQWIVSVKKRGITRICSLLSPDQLSYYETDLLGAYRQEFGPGHVCSAPVEDYRLCDPLTLTQTILPFLRASDVTRQPVVVHCSGGIGRTGHVLAAWLVFGRGFSVHEALWTVKRMGRNPFEAVDMGNATQTELCALLQSVHPLAHPTSR
jgi:protein-tyrosine phosphatase